MGIGLSGDNKVILDCGCGTKPRGDVNIDLVINSRTLNFIRCDAHHLSFRDKTFKKTYVLTVLEHLDKPYDAIREIFRVTDGEVIIRYDKFFSIYNFVGVGHKNLMVRERFVRLPHCLFLFLNYFIRFRPINYLARKGKLFESRTYEKNYSV